MSPRDGKRALAALSLTALVLLALPGSARAQDNPPASDANDPTMKKVSLDLESTNLYSALKLLFGHINANYYLDPSLKNAEVSVHLHDVPFKIVLDTLVKSTGLPLTWKFDQNIYRIVPREPDVVVGPERDRPAPPASLDAAAPKLVLLGRDTFAFDGLSISEVLGGKHLSVLPRLFDTNPYPGSQTGTGSGTGGRGGFGSGGLGSGTGNGSSGGSGSQSGGFGTGGGLGGGGGRGF